MSKGGDPVESRMVGRDGILGAADTKIEQVEAPEWGGHVCVRGMTGAEREQYEVLIMEGGKFTSKDIRAKLATFSICDQGGTLLFRPGDPDDVKALTAKSAVALNRVFRAAQRLSGLRPAVEEIAAILKNARSASSPTA